MVEWGGGRLCKRGREHVTKHMNPIISPVFCAIILFPTSSVRNAVPFSTISIIVWNALADKRSVGEIKFPAALWMTTFGRPSSDSILSTAAFTARGSLISN